jgi:Zn-dependent peptidase ImmA (M78 family)
VLDAICGLYGVPAEDVVVGAVSIDTLEPVQLLLKSSSEVLSDATRVEIARIAAARRAVKSLEAELGYPDRYVELRRQFKHEGVYLGPGGKEWEAGRNLALQLRNLLDLSDDEIVNSVQEVTRGLQIELVSANLSDPRMAGFSLADSSHGPVIVVNARGANSNPWVRRFTIAHELCHVLHDEHVHERLSVQLYESEAAHERRANAFAAHFLAPDAAVRRVLQELHQTTHEAPQLEREVRELMETLGINFKAACLRIIHVWNAPRDRVKALEMVYPKPDSRSHWLPREALWDEDYFPCPSVPPERRGLLSRLVAEALRREVMDRKQAAHLLEAAPDEPLEQLLELEDLGG